MTTNVPYALKVQIVEDSTQNLSEEETQEINEYYHISDLSQAYDKLSNDLEKPIRIAFHEITEYLDNNKDILPQLISELENVRDGLLDVHASIESLLKLIIDKMIESKKDNQKQL